MKRKILQSSFSRRLFNFFQSIFFKETLYSNNSLLKEFKKNGFVRLENFFSSYECEKVLKIIDKTIAEENKNIRDKNIETITNEQIYNKKQRLIYSFNYENTDSFINDIVYNKKLRNICEYLNQSKLNYVKHWTKRVYKRDNTTNNILMNERFHQDSVGLSSIRFIVYLNDINEEQGPFEYVEGSHKIEIPNIHTYIKENKEKLIKCYGKQGDVIIADVSGWHRANKVTQNERNTLQVLFISPLANKINKFFNFGTYLK